MPEGLYVNLDDINKKEAPVLDQPTTGNFRTVGNISNGKLNVVKGAGADREVRRSNRNTDKSSTLNILPKQENTPTGSGTVITNEQDNISGRLPQYKIQSNSNIAAIEEGAFISQIQFVGMPTNTADVQYNKVVSDQSSSFYKNEVMPFNKDPEKYYSLGKAEKVETTEGYNYNINKDVIEEYFGEKAMQKGYKTYNPTTYEFNKDLTTGDVVELQGKQYLTDLGKLGAGLADFGASVGKTVIYNFGVKGYKEGEFKRFTLGWQKVELPDVLGVKNKSSVQYGVSTFNVPLVNLKLPYKPLEFRQYLAETSVNPANMFSVGQTYLIASAGVKGFKAEKSLYKEVRSLGYSKTQAIDITIGETVNALNPIKISGKTNFIYPTGNTGNILKYKEVNLGGQTFKGGLIDFKPTQINYGDLATSTKIANVGNSAAYKLKGLPEQALYKQQGSFIYTSRLRGLTNDYYSFQKVDLASVQSVSIKDGLFLVKPTGTENIYKFKATGQREVYTFGNKLTQTGRFRFGTKNFATKEIESFSGFGKSKIFNLDTGLTNAIGKGTFKFKKLESGSVSYGKNPVTTYKTSGFVGRPRIGRGTDFNFEFTRYNEGTADISLSRSFSRLTSTSGKINTYFINKIISPKDKLIDIEFTGTGGPKNLGPTKGFKVENVYTKGEFNYLGTKAITKTNQIGKNIASAPTKLNLKPTLDVKTRTSNLGGVILKTEGKNVITSKPVNVKASILKSVTTTSVNTNDTSATTKTKLTYFGAGTASRLTDLTVTSLVTLPKITEITKLNPPNKIRIPSTNTPFIPQSFLIPPVFPKPKLNFDDITGGYRGFGVRGRRKYTPSFDALVRGIKGKQPKSQFTLALGTRPITKGFTFSFNKVGGKFL